MSAVRVTLDVSAVPPRPGGAGRYVAELAEAVAARDDVDLVAVSRRGDGERWRRLAGGSTVREVVPAARPVRLAWERWRMPALIGSARPDVHHCPHYTMPGPTPVPCVVTVHDLTFFDHPELHQRLKVAWFTRAIGRAAARAAAVVCVSHATARRLVELFPECRTRVGVIPHGVDLARFSPHPAGAPETLSRLGVTKPYLLHVGTVEPRKQVVTLVRALDRLERDDLSLVLAGAPGWRASEVASAIAASRRPELVRRLGYVPDGDLAPLMADADAVVYPSIEEGFGLPVLEALACGAPVVTTRGTAMEEVARGAAVLVEPGHPGELARAIEAVLGERESQRQSRRRQGLAVAAAHSWAASASAHAELYRQVAAPGCR